MSSAQWGPSDDRLAVVGVLLLVLGLLVARACLASHYHQAERPPSPPESFYEPGGG